MSGNPDECKDARETAFERDNYTCKLCGAVGYPKTELGLAAVPVEQGSYAAKNLVTVCHNCVQREPQVLNREIQRVSSRRQRETTRTRRSQQSSSDSSVANPTEASETNPSRIRRAQNSLLRMVSSFFATGYDSERGAEFELVDLVGARDNFHCQSCGSITQPRGRLGYIIYSVRGRDGEPSVDNQITVCMDCIDWRDQRTVARKIQKSSRLKFAEPEITVLYLRAILREFREKARLFTHTGRLIIFRRAIATVIGILSLVSSSVLLAGMLGALLVAPGSGADWMGTVIGLYRNGASDLSRNIWIGFVALGIGYLLHVFEQERAYKRQLYRDQRRRGDHPTISYARPRWQFVAGFACLGCVGALDWVLIHEEIFPVGMTLGAIVFWAIGSAGVAYYLRYACREDRDIDGKPASPAPWIFTARFGLLLGGLTIASTVLNQPLLSAPLAHITVLTAPLAGACYACVHYAEQRTMWCANILQDMREIRERMWPWSSRWPPTDEQSNRATTTKENQ